MSTHDKSLALAKYIADLCVDANIAKHVYVVGGAVRNQILSVPIKDLDVVIDSIRAGHTSEWLAHEIADSIPGEVSIATNTYGVAILSIVEPWILNGIQMKGEVIEIANARSESYSKSEQIKGLNYKPTEVKAATIEQDVNRREFTFNTLMMRMSDIAVKGFDAPVIDLTGRGLSDLRSGQMVTPDDPDKTFGDDPTRILRTIKFGSKYGFSIPTVTRDAARRHAHELKDMPHNAVSKLLIDFVFPGDVAKYAIPILNDLGVTKVIKEMMKEIAPFRDSLINWANTQTVETGWLVGCLMIWDFLCRHAWDFYLLNSKKNFVLMLKT